MKEYVLLAAALSLASLTTMGAALAAPPDAVLIERGRHLVDLAVCGFCHSPRDPKTNEPVPGDFSGGTIGRMEKDVGVFWPPNLTPHKKTGLGLWTDEQIITAITKGVRPDGRELAKVMPYERYGKVLSDDEVRAIVAYLRSVKAIDRKNVSGHLIAVRFPFASRT